MANYTARYSLPPHEEGEELKCESCKRKFYIGTERGSDKYNFQIVIFDEDEWIRLDNCTPACATQTIKDWELNENEYRLERKT